MLFARINTLSFEEGTPDSKINLGVDWSIPLGAVNFGVNLKGTRYGERGRNPACRRPPEINAGVQDARDLHIQPDWVVDLALNAKLLEDKLAFSARRRQPVRPVSGPRAERARGAESPGRRRESERHECAGVFALFAVRLQRPVRVTPAWPTTGEPPNPVKTGAVRQRAALFDRHYLKYLALGRQSLCGRNPLSIKP